MPEQIRLCEVATAASGGSAVSMEAIRTLTKTGSIYPAHAASLGYYGLCGACREHVNLDIGQQLVLPPDCLGVRPEQTSPPEQP